MKKLFLLILILISSFIFVRASLAQEESSQSASPVQLTYPIAELGDCSSAASCKTYCDDPTHIEACVAYAKAKGFYHETALDSEQSAILADAETSLGCNTLDSCRAFCQQSQNADACSAFAQKHNLRGGIKTPDSTTLEKAKAVLGCSSAETCQAFCQQEENKVKCEEFAKSNGLNGGDQTIGPGGCTSESSCKIFCSDPNNFQTCQQFVASHESTSSGQHTFSGPGGCTSEDSCRAYCQQNPTACHLPLLSGTPSPLAHPSGLPTLSPQQYCAKYPDHCPYLTPTVTVSTPTRYPTPNYTEYCASKGCVFTGTACACPTPTHTQDTTPTLIPNTTLPLTPTVRPPTPTPTGTVKAAATQRNFFDWLVGQLFH